MAQIVRSRKPEMAAPHASASAPAIDARSLAEARSAALPAELLELVADTFHTLADPTRLRILYGLSTGPMPVRDLALLAAVSESAVSHQLRLLRDRHLVTTRRAGNVIYYELDDHHLAALFREAEYHADHVRHGRDDHPYPRSVRAEHEPVRKGPP